VENCYGGANNVGIVMVNQAGGGAGVTDQFHDDVATEISLAHRNRTIDLTTPVRSIFCRVTASVVSRGVVT
jgi:hypothetical protein